MNKEKETLNNFILKGEFNTAPFGLDKTAFIEKFEKSQDYLTVSSVDKRIKLMKYDIIEFYFSESNSYEKLDGVMFQPKTFPSDKLKFDIDLQWITDGLTYGEVRSILKREDIEFKEQMDEIQQRIIETTKGVRFYFYEEEKDLVDWELNKFGKFRL